MISSCVADVYFDVFVLVDLMLPLRLYLRNSGVAVDELPVPLGWQLEPTVEILAHYQTH